MNVVFPTWTGVIIGAAASLLGAALVIAAILRWRPRAFVRETSVDEEESVEVGESVDPSEWKE